MSNIPIELKYSKEHQWIKVEGEVGTVGITDYAQSKLTDIVFIELPERGKKFEKDKKLATIESVKSVSDVFCPVNGEIIEINKELINAPDKLNSDPYGGGWIAKIRVRNKTDLNSLMSAEQYKKYIESAN